MLLFPRVFRWLAVVAGLPAFVLLAAAPASQAQQPTPTDVPASQAAGIIREITDAVGLQPRFELRATDRVANAAAVVYDGRRYLLYNPRFLADINQAGHTDWAGISILAHEMGHHLNGHTLRGGGSQPQDELEADEFSGFVLRRLGASLAQAQAALAAVAPEEGSASHPGRAPRLAAISQGWGRANAQIVASSQAGRAQPSAQPIALAPTPPAAEEEANEPDPADASLARQVSAAPVWVVGQLTFRANPDVPYYLTSALNVVRLADEDADEEGVSEAQVVGRLRRTSNAAFPFVLEDSQRHQLFVTPGGDVYDRAGQRVAKLHE